MEFMDEREKQDIELQAELAEAGLADDILDDRPIEVVTAEILAYKQQAGYAVLEIGRRLIEAKELLSHGEWLPWLKEKVEFSEASAQRFMRLAREYTNPSTVTDLGTAKALQLLVLPASEREDFLAENHDVGAGEKTVYEMSTRELAIAIKERDEARQKSADYEAELKLAREEADEARQKSASYEAELKLAKEKAVEQARDEVEQTLTAKIKKAEKARDLARAKLKELENKQQAVDDLAEKEKERLTEQVRDLKKRLAVADAGEAVAAFKLYFEQVQEDINWLFEQLDKVCTTDAETAERLKQALAALLSKAQENLV